ncbi:hypothetical protein QBC41DRAFT_71755 [Cercophora samala]|uniref:Ubiquitin interaction domain-containing protein n=1 Tax=Cercophora samala TaxID=330535 RepID=A0AA40DGD3_9PEZI|nr:hypothetical protein QBC41DRAFT_71755 [Cercophora samala]
MADELVLTPEEQDAIGVVSSVIDFPDKLMLVRALRSHKNNTNAVCEEWFQLWGTDEWVKKYKENIWEELPGLEATEPSNITPLLGAASSPSFRIQGEDQVLYGQTPGTTGAPPTRVPSRADNRAPTSKEQEEEQMQMAMAASLAGQTPALPPRPSSAANGQFGPATRDHYAEQEWATTVSSYYPPPLEDEVPSCRSRDPRLPAFLRRRPNHNSHLLGGLLVILQRIPAARNTLLKIGAEPAWGYHCTQDWWKGEPITTEAPRWEYEVHRLMAFLEGTTRSYATADILAQFPVPDRYYDDDDEKEFFHRLAYNETLRDTDDPSSAVSYSVFMSDVEVVSILDTTGHHSSDSFDLLDLYLPTAFACPEDKCEGKPPKTLYDYVDLLFYPDIPVAAEDMDQGMLAMIQHPSSVLTLRTRDPSVSNVEIPEIFYLDRYMACNRDKLVEISKEQIDLYNRKLKAMKTSRDRATFKPSGSAESKPRKELALATIESLKGKLESMRKRALWRDYNDAYKNGENVIYLPSPEDQPSWSDPEKEILAHYITRIEQLEQVIARTNDVTKKLKENVLDPITAEYEANAAKFTTPSDDPSWNPTYKYTLVGAVIGDSQVLLRWTGEPLDDVIQEASAPEVEDAGGWWLKVSYRNRVEYEFLKLKSVLDMWNNSKDNRMLVYADDSAMNAQYTPLPARLQKFVKDDNHFFKKELETDQSKGPEAETSKKRGVNDEWAGVSGPGKLRRSASLDTLSSNRASAGSQNGGDKGDEVMRDVGDTMGGGSLGEKGVSVAVQEMVERRTSAFFPIIASADAYEMAQDDAATRTDTSNLGSGDGNGIGSGGSAADPIKINGDGDRMVTE